MHLFARIVPFLYNLCLFEIRRQVAVSISRLFTNNLVECRRGFTIKEWPHLIASFIMGRTAMHCLERGLIFEFNYGRVIPSIYRFQKSSAYKTLNLLNAWFEEANHFLKSASLPSLMGGKEIITINIGHLHLSC
jgi:hypothetical protein